MTLEQSVHSNQPQGSRFVLVTGGAGYIATHTVVELASAGYLPVLLDNLSNSKRDAVRRVERIVGRTLPFYEADIRSRESLRAIFAEHPFEAVIHFAGLKAVGESVSQPLRYYDNNVTGTITLCEVMAEFGVKRLVFSSSATVYGDPASVPIRENFPVGGTTNPYGRSKYIVECILQDLVAAGGENWNIVLLRYFNPVGAHPSGLIGEDPRGTPNNLMPFIAQVAVGKRSHLNVFGNDYPTPDGTGVRDYIHVVDLAQGHVAALKFLGNESTSQRINESAQREAGGEQAESPSSLSSFEGRQARGRIVAINLGTGRGYSVLEMTQAFEKASGRKVPYQIVGRRPGDIASCYADPALAKKLLGWQATRGIDEMCVDTWRWQQGNPDGY